MGAPEKALETQLRNIEAKTGKTIAELKAQLAATGIPKHGELRSHAMQALGLGYGDANTLAHLARTPDAAGGRTVDDAVAEIYTGKKAPLRSIHDALMTGIEAFGDFEVAPKKGYLSLRRKKQFATIGPGGTTRVDVGLNMKGVPPTSRLLAEKPGGMCQYKVKIGDTSEVDAELLVWIRQAYDAAG